MKLAVFFACCSVAVSNPFAPKHEEHKASYFSQLMQGSISTRRLAEADYAIDISSYSVQFEQCQFVKSYDDELAQDRDSGTVLATKRFVLFKLCSNSGCSSCNDGYGEYMIDLQDYLEATVGYFQDYQKGMCNTCNQICPVEEEAAAGEQQQEGDNAGRRQRRLNNNQQQEYQYDVDCSTCLEECQKIQNMQANGYLDATEFLECKMIYDPADDNKEALYAGPVCVNSGKKIKIGVFSDPDCLFLDSNKEVDDYLVDANGNSMRLSHALLKSTYLDTCMSCKEPQAQAAAEGEDQEENQRGNDRDDADNVVDMCEQLYDGSAKCEAQLEISYTDGEGYENQKSQEDTICQFIASLRAGTYDESGEIIVSGSRISGGTAKASTGGQKFALTFFIIGTLGLAGYAAVLHSKLVKGGKVELASSGGAMA